MSVLLHARPLERSAFAAFGDVIETDSAHHYMINDGWATRYHDLARLDLMQQEGRPCLSLFRALPRPRPVILEKIERHGLSSQAFVPLSTIPFLVVVAAPGPAPQRPEQLSVFITNGRQGVNYAPGVWHHPLLAIDSICDFTVIDRLADKPDCDEIDIATWMLRVQW